MPLFASVLLAAGSGTRLRPLTETIPKPGLPLLDVPLAAWGLVDLKVLGCPVMMNLSRDHDVVRRALGPVADGIEILVEDPEPIGTAGTIAALRERVIGTLVTRNADLLSSLSSADVLATHRSSRAPATIAVQPVAEQADLVRDGSRLHLVDRRVENVAGDRFLGLSVFEPAALELIDSTGPRDLATGLLAHLIDREMVATHVHDGYALDVGTPPRYLEASLDLLYGRAPATPVPLPGTIVEVDGGRAYLGPGADVAPGTLGPGAVVLAGARIAPGSHIENAVVWPGEKVPTSTRVTDCIWTAGTALT